MNARRALGWMYRRIVSSAEAGGLHVRSEGKLRPALDGDDIDAWLDDRPLPSVIRFREQAPDQYRAAGVEVG